MSEEIRPPVLGLAVDVETRCAHWRSARDIVAIKMRCCGAYYACKDCHDALAGHAIEIWPLSARGKRAVMCGGCGEEMTIAVYLTCDDACPSCGLPFNPGCRGHRHFYFEGDA